MKNKKSGSENKEFHHRPTIKDNTTSTKNLPKVTLFDNNFSNIQKDEKTSEPLKHVSLVFTWDLYEQIVKFSKKRETTVTNVIIDSIKQYLTQKTESMKVKKLKQKIIELEKERSGGEHEFDSEEKIMNQLQKDSKN